MIKNLHVNIQISLLILGIRRVGVKVITEKENHPKDLDININKEDMINMKTRMEEIGIVIDNIEGKKIIY